MALKPIRKTDTTTLISFLDEAIDQEATPEENFDRLSGPEGYRNPALWQELITLKQSMSPTVFVIGVIPPSEMVRIQDECMGSKKFNELRWRAFLYGVRDIKGWEDSEQPAKKMIDGVEYVDPVWLERTFVRSLHAVGLFVGGYVWAFNQYTGEDSKN